MNPDTQSSDPTPSHDRRCPRCAAMLVGRHCSQFCGYSVAAQARDAQRPPSGSAANDLHEVMLQHGLTLPRNAPDWRVPPEPLRGYIEGLNSGTLSVLCTDGVVAYFLRSDGTVLHGHLQHFTPERSERAGGTGKRGAARAAKLQAKLAELDELLGL